MTPIFWLEENEPVGIRQDRQKILSVLSPYHSEHQEKRVERLETDVGRSRELKLSFRGC